MSPQNPRGHVQALANQSKISTKCEAEMMRQRVGFFFRAENVTFMLMASKVSSFCFWYVCVGLLI